MMLSENGNSKTLVIGARGGIGSALVKKLGNCHTLTSDDLDLNQPQQVSKIDLRNYETVINCAGHSKGTYLGFQKNKHENIISQINVNYTSNLLLLKRLAEQRDNGKYVWISSDVMDHARPFHSVYASSKVASQYAMKLIAEECKHIRIIEIKFGLARTNFRFNNFLGTKNAQEIEKSYENAQILEPDYIADQIIDCLNSSETFRHIK